MNVNDPSLTFPETTRVIEEGIEGQLHTGMQIYVSLSGKTIANFGYGEMKPGSPMTPDSITLWLSCGKPISAVALASLKERELLNWDDPVVQFLPEMKGPKKDQITIKHLLTHTSGLKQVITGWPHARWQEIIENVSRMELVADPGTRAEYQPACTWFLIGEIIARVSGKDYQEFLKSEILDPIGMKNTYCGMSHEEFLEYQSRIAWMYARRKNKLTPLEIHSELQCCAPSPGGNFRGTASDLGRFYEMMMDCLRENRKSNLIQQQTARELITSQRTGMYDHTFCHEINMGLGFVLDSRKQSEEHVPYGYGKQSSKNSFGHGGAQSSIGFCDPDQELVIVAISNGMAGEPRHHKRSYAILDALHKDLNIG